jgi:hypothetical protein
MDPKATLKVFWQHMADNDLEEAFYSLSNLINWLNKDGFIPEELELSCRFSSVEALKNLRRAIKAASR